MGDLKQVSDYILYVFLVNKHSMMTASLINMLCLLENM